MRTLKYTARLTLEEASDRLHEVQDTFSTVQRRYWLGNTFGFHRNMREADQATLAECLGVLLPLSMQASVQEDAYTTHDDVNLANAITLTNIDIAYYLSQFKNTGVRLLYGNIDL